MTDTINRETGDKAKGFRLQKYRAIIRALDIYEINKTSPFSFEFSIEDQGDVRVSAKIDESEITTLEEDKLYESGSKFSLNHKKLLNTLVYFLDIWIKNDLSKKIFFGFYTTAEYAKENKTKRTKALKITLPEAPLCELIQDINNVDDTIVSIISQLIEAEYAEQYSSNDNQGYLETIQSFDCDRWKEFLGQIDWMFEAKDLQESKDEALEAIRNSSIYDRAQMKGTEENILSLLVDKLDEAQSNNAIDLKRLSRDSLRNAFLEIAKGSNSKNDDPVYMIWKDIPKPDDTRNIEEKINDVCEYVSTQLVEDYNLAISMNLSEADKFSGNKNFVALKLRLFRHCKILIKEFVQENKDKKLSEDEIKEFNQYLVTECQKKIEELKKDYSYPLTNRDSIEGIILNLFNSCFLAYEVNPVSNL